MEGVYAGRVSLRKGLELGLFEVVDQDGELDKGPSRTCPLICPNACHLIGKKMRDLLYGRTTTSQRSLFFLNADVAECETMINTRSFGNELGQRFRYKSIIVIY